MASTPAQKVFKDLEAGQWFPQYLVVGEESFQFNEILDRLKAQFLKDETAKQFQYETWDGEHLDEKALLQSLDTLPGLFAEEQSVRLVVLHRLEKASASALTALESYFSNPSPTTCLLIQAAKVDRRKAWYKSLDSHGVVVEVAEPYDRDWPKWYGYLEKRLGKRVAPECWEPLVEASGRTLSVLWSELNKAATYVGKSKDITLEDVSALVHTGTGGTVFDFVDDVLCRRAASAMERYHLLLKSHESEVKLLSLLVRQFRIVEQYGRCIEAGLNDSRVIAGKVGVHPFFLTQIQRQSRYHRKEELSRVVRLLADSDYRMKTGEAGLFEGFLVPYFGA